MHLCARWTDRQTPISDSVTYIIIGSNGLIFVKYKLYFPVPAFPSWNFVFQHQLQPRGVTSLDLSA
jgi:hypothetical protein